jgi:Ca2+/H+ antiporter, TMEM165/GDT1 family
VVVVVAALAAHPAPRTAAYVGASVAAAAVVALGVLVHRPLRGLPETELKYVVGLMLTTFGTFFCAEGLGYDWPLGDAALLVVLGVWLAWSQTLVRVMAR